MTKKVVLTEQQREQLDRIWFVYGNRGPKSSMSDHRFIQCFLEHDEDTRDFFKPSQECLEQVDKILKGDE
jgi:hypothetical protein